MDVCRMSVECTCKRSKVLADTIESFLCQFYIKQGERLFEGAFVLGDVCPGEVFFGGGTCPGGGRLSYLRPIHGTCLD